MNVREMAREMSSGCPHSQPIVIPCHDCIEKRIVATMVETKREYRDAMKEQWDAMVTATGVAKRDAEAATKQRDKIAGTFERMRQEIISLKAQNRAAMETISEMTLQLHAEQAIKADAKLRSGIVEADA